MRVFDPEAVTSDLRGLALAALLGETRWEDFLDRLRLVLPNGAATLFYHDSATDRGAFSLAAGLSDEALSAYSSRYSALNPWMAAATRRPIGLATPDSAMFCRQALQRTEFYNDYLRPNHLQGAVGITIDRRESCNFFLSVLGDTPETAEHREILAILRSLVPDLRRAFEFHRRVPLLADGPDVEGAALPGALALGPRRRLHGASGLARTELERGRALSVSCAGRVEFRDRRIADHADLCLAWLCSRQAAPAPRVFLTARPPGLPLKVTVMARPWADGAQYFRGPECVILVEPGARPAANLAEVAHHYGLTPAELRLATGLLAGLSLSEIAADAGVTVETARSHLRALFAKTETHRQPDLVRLLMALAC
ncbi:helix-turn-helix transcriptional regulator [Limimaricola pyoseonensis]|uniref:DNA-binding transcriptional regulator, CsgD family n=1 Tax=Limimaricola pyoseonensis TaxID=521013 RepID=A0A1G7B3C3_9RHOB|nr:helix-turn-helix transcriptional regulator [Limimaricola pyoseonensis]SDE21521.1 DNA-binding transcriptional regulator, CsgD family [Limimaricola pyoseonensis]